MNNINFEEDKQNALTKVNDAESLSEQALKLKAMEKDLADKEDEIKKLKIQERRIICPRDGQPLTVSEGSLLIA